MKLKETLIAFLWGIAAIFAMTLATVFLSDKLGFSLLSFDRQSLLLVVTFVFMLIGGYLATKKTPNHTPFAAVAIGGLFFVAGYLDNKSESFLPARAFIFAGAALVFGAFLGWIVYNLNREIKRRGWAVVFALVPSLICFFLADRAISNMIRGTASIDLHLGLNIMQLNELFAQNARLRESTIGGCLEFEYWLGMARVTVVKNNGELYDLAVKRPFQGTIAGVRLGDNVTQAGLKLIKNGYSYDNTKESKEDRIVIFFAGKAASLHLYVNQHDLIQQIVLNNSKYTITVRPL